MPKRTLTLVTLPTELIVLIFVHSSNPALVLTCRTLNQTLAPLTRSIATRIDFLFIRYRHNYIKAVIKGLRWSFFDLELLTALDRLYKKERQRVAEVSTKKTQLAIAIGASKPSPQPLQEHSIPPLNTSSTIASNPSTREAPESDRPKKKRKKYQVNQNLPETVAVTNVAQDGARSLNDPSLLASTTDTTSISKTEAGDSIDERIPLPLEFPIPRGLFKSENHQPLIRELLSRGGSPSYPSGYPLVRACQRGDVDMVKLLLFHGARPEVKALRWACVEEHNEVLDIFLEIGVMPDQECLKRCVEMGKFKMTNRLLELGVVPDMKTLMCI
ncbi:hypothetical protein BGZ50_004440 [Haplosporangium sp. Z 11]|nr:hypothetical protein BGZ50_004440 [Haplosporangium sp. Z 11]